MTVWVSLLGTVIGAATAFAGVYFTARAAGKREVRNRLWDKRAELYVEALQFLHDIRTYSPPPNRNKPDPHEYWPTRNRIAAQLAVFGDKAIADAFGAAASPSNWSKNYYEPPPKEATWAYAEVIEFEALVHEALTGEPSKLPRAAAAPSASSRLRLSLEQSIPSLRRRAARRYAEQQTQYGTYSRRDDD